MNTEEDILEIVDEQDNIIGLDTRKNIHKLGLLHREIHIWFVTPVGEIVFQHRSKNKETYPDLLDSTVGGHVEKGATYEETAIKECFEETGVKISPEDLIFITKLHIKTTDEVTSLINNSMRTQYAYLYKGDIKDLKIEKEDGAGFELWSIDALNNISEDDKNKFISAIFTKDLFFIFEKIEELVLNK